MPTSRAGAPTARELREATSTRPPETPGHQAERASLRRALGVYTFLFLLQVGGYMLTGILVLLAEAYHTLSDVLVSGFLLYALAWSRKPADEFHMFGHGRAQNVATLVSATIFIFIMGLEALREAVPRLLGAQVADAQNPMIAAAVTVTAMLVSLYPLYGVLRVKERGPSLKAQLTGLVKDEVSYASALIGVYMVSLGYG